MKYQLQQSEIGYVIDEFMTYDEAKAKLNNFEVQDRHNGDYVINFYRIVEIEDTNPFEVR